MAGELEPGCLAVMVNTLGCEADGPDYVPRPGAEKALGRQVTVGAASPYCRCCVLVEAQWLVDELLLDGEDPSVDWDTHRANLRRIDGFDEREARREALADRVQAIIDAALPL